LIVGHTTHDRYGEGIRAGGCAYYGAQVYDALGAGGHLATLVGEDFQCDWELDRLEKTVLRHGETTFFANLYPERGPRLQLLAAWAPMMAPGMFDEALLDDEVVHLAPVLGELDLVKWKAAVDPELLAINVQGWIKVPDPDAGGQIEVSMPDGADVVVQRPWEVSVEELEGVDVASLSDEDLIDHGDLEERLIEAIPIVAVTHGDRGASIYVDGQETRLGVYEQADVADPTGAGDTFAAAFVHRLHAGDDPVEAGRFASAAASIVIEGDGASEVDRLGEAGERAKDVERKTS